MIVDTANTALTAATMIRIPQNGLSACFIGRFPSPRLRSPVRISASDSRLTHSRRYGYNSTHAGPLRRRRFWRPRIAGPPADLRGRAGGLHDGGGAGGAVLR